MALLTADSKRALILGSARRLLIRRGFQDIVLDDVAREAGVAKGTLFLYFKSKDELFSAAYADLVDQLALEMDRLLETGKTGKPLLEDTVRVVLDYFERNQDFMSQFGLGRFTGCGDRSCEKLMEKFSANTRRMASILKLALKRAKWDRKELEFAAVSLFGICRSANVHRMISGDRRPLVSRGGEVMRQFLFGTEGKA